MPQDDEPARRSSAEWFRISGGGWQYLPGTPVRLSPFAQTNRVPTAVPNLFLVTTVATHCDSSLVPIVPSVPYV
jgi:hypothetical protein